MLNLAKKQIIQLIENQNIADVITLGAGNTLVTANTGTGKSWFVLNKLMLDGHVIFLCPTIGQVKQLEETYSYRSDISFIYGAKSISSKAIPKLVTQNLVMTYDQFIRFESSLDKRSILVIDECQKLYAAGNFRNKAIQPILESIRSKKYEQCVFLTATLTETLFAQLDIQIDTYYEIQNMNELTRNIHILNYEVQHEFNWYYDVLQRLQVNRELGRDKLIILRLNDINLSRKVKLMFENSGFKTQLINRDEIAKNKCHDMLSTEKIDDTYQVVICTSVMDEAINLNNTNEEVDSIHVIGKYAHPEEITQFIGRMRKANPNIFIHLSEGIDKKKIQPEKFHKKSVTNIQSHCEALIQYLETRVKPLLEVDSFNGFEELVPNKIDKVELLNNISSGFVKCKGFWSVNNEIRLNTSSIVGRLYQMDQQKCYENVWYLKYRLECLMPRAKVKFVLADHSVSLELINELQECEKLLKTSKKTALNDVAKKVIELLQPNAILVRKMLLESSQLNFNPYQYDQPVHYGIFQEMVTLSSRLENLVDMTDAIEKERTDRVLKLGYHYQNNPIVKYILGKLSIEQKEKGFMEKSHSIKAITSLLNQWITQISDNRTIDILLKEYPLPYFTCSAEDKIVFTEESSINFLRNFTHVKVMNSRKSTDSKKIVFLGLCAHSYSFIDIPASIQKKIIKIDDQKYDGTTGQLEV